MPFERSNFSVCNYLQLTREVNNSSSPYGKTSIKKGLSDFSLTVKID